MRLAAEDEVEDSPDAWEDALLALSLLPPACCDREDLDLPEALGGAFFLLLA
ncbi:hypothetical protein GCM10008094_29410 [Aidingimonas halophila]|nr:hypothetical protein GCM10008094_29410 [Aidingimonas halophila]